MKPSINVTQSRRFAASPRSFEPRRARLFRPSLLISIVPAIVIAATQALPNNPAFAGAAARSFDPLHAVIGVLVILGVTFWGLDGQARGPFEPPQGADSPYRSPPRLMRTARAEAPGAGILPLLFMWATFAWPLPIAVEPRLAHYAAALAFAMGLAVLLSIALADGRGESAAARSALFTAALVLGEWLILPVPAFGLYASVLSFSAAAALDVVDEFEARKRWGEQVVAAVERDAERAEALLAALDRAGIPAHARDVHQRALLPIFGGLPAITILVPKAQVDEAMAILDEARGEELEAAQGE